MSGVCPKIDIGRESLLSVKLTWQGEVDLDLSAFILNDEGYIDNESDLVFYNSTNRNEVFDPEVFANEEDWISKTVPVSSDGSITGSSDAEGVAGCRTSESITIDFVKIKQTTNRIIVCVSKFKPTLKTAESNAPLKAEITIIDKKTDKSLLSSTHIVLGGEVTAVEVFEISRVSDDNWICQQCNTSHCGGLHSIIDKYV